MKEKIIQGGIVNGVKMLVCPTWEEDFQNDHRSARGLSERAFQPHLP